MADARLVAMLAALRLPGQSYVPLEGIDVTPELLDIMRSVRCVSCAELGHDEEGFGFVPTSEQEGDGSVGLTALCARHLPVFVRKLRPAGMAPDDPAALIVGHSALPPHPGGAPRGPGALRRLKCTCCKTMQSAAAQADVLIPVTRALDDHPLKRSAADLLLMGLCFDHVLQKLHSRS
jgi:hypothetical protein